jgi:hypothetical protein
MMIHDVVMCTSHSPRLSPFSRQDQIHENGDYIARLKCTSFAMAGLSLSTKGIPKYRHQMAIS